MSWFSEIAGKAEDFLNKIDQNAAEVINQAAAVAEGRSNKPRLSSTVVVDKVEQEQLVNGGGQKEWNGTSTSSSIGNGTVITIQEKPGSPLSKNKNKGKGKMVTTMTSNGNGPVPSPSTASKTKEDEDKELIEFLNDTGRRELDEKLVMQTELANQAREVELLYKTNKQLQADNEIFKSKLSVYEQGGTEQSRIQTLERQLKDVDSVQRNLKKMLAEKDRDISKLKKSLDQSLEKLQQLEKLQSTQNRLEQVEMDKQKLLQANEDLKGEITIANERIDGLDHHLATIKSSMSSVESEFASYKEKAKSILKQKDDLISSLQSGTAFGAGQMDDSAMNPYHSEINALKSERELLNAEISQCRSTSDSLREETQRLESELHTLRTSTIQCQKLLADEKSLSRTLQDENLLLQQQLSSVQFELNMEKSERRKVEEWKTQRETEDSNNAKGRASPYSERRIKNTSNSNGDTEEALRMRITALSQSLLEKQALINSISSDKQLLQINVERLQEQVQLQQAGSSYQGSSNSDFSQAVIINKPLYLSESPWDSGMSSRVKRAFSTVDGLCCQAGLVLRRRPNLRLGFCIYILVLHFWVLFIIYHFIGHVPHQEPFGGPSSGPVK